jgi:hypothetical protein
MTGDADGWIGGLGALNESPAVRLLAAWVVRPARGGVGRVELVSPVLLRVTLLSRSILDSAGEGSISTSLSLSLSVSL